MCGKDDGAILTQVTDEAAYLDELVGVETGGGLIEDEELGIAEKTVKNRVTVILQTLGMQRRTQVAAMVAARRRACWKPQ